MRNEKLRNIAIIAHVDHGKTTLVDEMLKQSGVYRENQETVERVMDSNDLERERGITILAKNTAIQYGDTKINIVDTPGHADFGGEVERILKMVNGVILLVDAAEGPMPQTRFVLSRALELGHRVIVVVNKIDRPDQRIHEVIDEVLELLLDLDATPEQLDSPMLFCSARQGVASYSPDVPGTDLKPLFDTILSYIPAPEADLDQPFQMLVSAIDYNEFVGRIAIGRVERGVLKQNQEIAVCNYHDPDAPAKKAKAVSMYEFQGLGKQPITEATAGNIIAMSGIGDITIGDTICAPECVEPLPFVKISAPTMEMTFSVNDSPYAGREGKFVTSRQLRDRLFRETLKDVSLRVTEIDGATDAFNVAGRGEMSLSILIETMRREGYEFQVSPPRVLYRTIDGKFNAVADDIAARHAKGQPCLIGTVSIENSEKLSRLLDKRGIKHETLNAKHHEREAHIVAQAGRLGAVTIATNMAGRGTDIKLTPEVKAAGGLAIIGTERHESRRVDRQLRGRAGRQGDPGSSQFFVSLEDDLMRLFGSGRIASMMDRMGLKEGEVIQAGMMTRAIERAQNKVEENNFGIRKRLLEYDDVMNSQREVIYTRRRHALYGERIEIDLNNIMYDYADNFVEENRGIEFEDFRMELIREVAVEPQIDEATYKDAKPGELVEAIVKALKEAYARRAKAVADTVRPVMERIYEDRKDQLDSNIYFPLTDGHLGYNVPVNLRKCQSSDGAEIYKVFSKVVMFTTIDDAWREHLREMDDLRQSVQNATYEQKDPLLIYKFESFGLFSKMIIKVNRDVLAILNKAYIPVRDQNAEAVQRQQQERAKVDVNKLQASRMQAAAQAGQEERQKPMPLHAEKKAGRNDPCPCGSGKKYKNCHGKGL